MEVHLIKILKKKKQSSIQFKVFFIELIYWSGVVLSVLIYLCETCNFSILNYIFNFIKMIGSISTTFAVIPGFNLGWHEYSHGCVM